MPRGFLVKRSKKNTLVSYRSRSYEEEREDLVQERLCFSHHYSPCKPFHSPDSGYGESPVAPSPEYDAFPFEVESIQSVPSPTFSTRSLPSPLHSPVTSVPNVSSISAPSTPKQQAATSLKNSSNATKRPFTDRPTLTKPSQKAKKSKYKAARKLNFSEENDSPVNGTIIVVDDNMKELTDKSKDINSNGITVTSPGDIVCQLCKDSFNDPLSLAQHKCSRIVHVEYRCPECDKVFNCPANLASHRRWHKPRPTPVSRPANASPPILPASVKLDVKTVLHDDNICTMKASSPMSDTTMSLSDRSTPSPRSTHDSTDERFYGCDQCGKKFRRQGYLRKHKKQHSESKSHPCRYCGRVFNSLTCREKHLLTHLVSTQVVCHICGGLFVDKVALEQHSHVHDATGEMFYCKYCIHSFHTSAGLTRHLNICHSIDNRNVVLLHVPRMSQEMERSMISA